MTIDLWMLLCSAALQWLLINIPSNGRILVNGLGWAVSSRDEPGDEAPLWVQRAQRASDNLAENLPLAAIVILVVAVSGHANGRSALGAEIFFGARVVHAIVYLAGVPVVRTLAWIVSLLGLAIAISVVF